MKRSPGVTFAAVVALVGSILILLLGLVMAIAMMFVPIPSSGQLPASPTFMRVVFLLLSLLYLLPAGWGIATSVGLFRLKNWARVSMIIFAVLLSAMGLFTGLGSLLITIPQGVATPATPVITFGAKVGMALFWFALLGIGIWWLVLFTRAAVKTQFRPAQPPPPSMPGAVPMPHTIPAPLGPQRPLSISIIGWLLLVGCVFFPMTLLLHFPAVLFTSVLTGWAATLCYLGYAVVHFFVGRGLLQLKPWARQLAIGFYIFGFVNTAVFYFAPGARSRMKALVNSQSSMFWWEKLAPNQPHIQMDPSPLFPLFALLGLIAIAVPIYFLVTRKAAFAAHGN
jgi:hypothetical protein